MNLQGSQDVLGVIDVSAEDRQCLNRGDMRIDYPYVHHSERLSLVLRKVNKSLISLPSMRDER